MLKRLSEEEAKELLRVCRVGRLGCIVDGRPYVVPVSYVYAEEGIYIHSLPGLKVQALRANPRACLQVDRIIDDFNWKSAIAFGEYEELRDPAEHAWAVRRLLIKFPQLTPVESVPVHDGQSSVIIFAIRVKKVTGVGES
jgi:nitroimidazol reductase NimA-like FMN-containing flavoprotein (pyridoxamine 5'-phosphate oxidase superfamily)